MRLLPRQFHQRLDTGRFLRVGGHLLGPAAGNGPLRQADRPARENEVHLSGTGRYRSQSREAAAFEATRRPHHVEERRAADAHDRESAVGAIYGARVDRADGRDGQSGVGPGPARLAGGGPRGQWLQPQTYDWVDPDVAGLSTARGPDDRTINQRICFPRTRGAPAFRRTVPRRAGGGDRRMARTTRGTGSGTGARWGTWERAEMDLERRRRRGKDRSDDALLAERGQPAGDAGRSGGGVDVRQQLQTICERERSQLEQRLQQTEAGGPSFAPG